MKIIDQIPEQNLEFVEHALLNGNTFYEIYYFGTKLFQCKNNFKEAVENWTSVIGNVGT